MKKIYPCLALAVVGHTALSAGIFDQDSTRRIILRDTTTQEKTIPYGPLGNRQVNSLSYSATTINDREIFQLSSGLSIFNTLRGQVPNAEIGASALTPFTTLRGQTPLLVIDGLPLNQAITGNYNFNAFEYKSISAISSGNAAAGFYATSGMSGALLLQSKTGEGYDRPTIEVNSYSTLASRRNTIADLTDTDNTIQQWVLSNAVAYMQDFGAFDTRISGNFTTQPSPSTGTDAHTRSYAFRINSGVSITQKFTARVILDSYYQKLSSSDTSPYYTDGTQQNDGLGHQKLWQANLALSYQLLEWLKVSTQGSLSKIENDNRDYSIRSFPNASPPAQFLETLSVDHKRTFANLFLSANKKLSTNFSLTAFTGFQYEKFKSSQESLQAHSAPDYSIVSFRQWMDPKINSWLNGVGFNYHGFVFADASYRRDRSSGDHADTYAASGSFVYSEAFHLKGNFFSSGKIRGSIGKTDLVNVLTYPYAWPESNIAANLPVSGKNFEAGTDVGLMNDRFTFSMSYFRNTYNSTYMYYQVPWGGGWGNYLIDAGRSKMSGWETALSAVVMKHEKIQWSTKLIWSKYKYRLDAEEGVPAPTDNPTLPDWRISMLNQLNWKNLFFSVLIDARRGGTFTQMLPGYPPTFIFDDGSQVKLRDVSVGIDLTPALLGRIGIREAKLSLSGRNLWTMYSKSSSNVIDSFYTGQYLRTGSLSLTLLF